MMLSTILSYATKNEIEAFNSVMRKYVVRDFSKSSKAYRRNNPELASIYADIEAARKRLRRQNDRVAQFAIKREIKAMSRDYEAMMCFRNKMLCIVEI